MKVLGISIIQKSFLLPVILTVAFFLVAMGMRPPQLQRVNKPRILNRVTVQDQEKISQTGFDQIIHAVEPSRCVELVKPPAYSVSVFPVKERNSNIAAVPFISSRAPPASQV
jgi:hypothetical protein